MHRFSKQLIYGGGLLFGVFLFFEKVLAQGGLEKAAGRAGLPNISVGKAIGNVIGTGLSLVSVLFFILMIIGGLRYMLSRGNEETAKKAVNTIWGAMIGLFIVLAAYALTNFVFGGLGISGGGPGSGFNTEYCLKGCNPDNRCIAYTPTLEDAQKQGKSMQELANEQLSTQKCKEVVSGQCPAQCGGVSGTCHQTSSVEECKGKAVGAACGSAGESCKKNSENVGTGSAEEYTCLCTALVL
ncbi:MAG: pilin [Candidatus Magasanikbacteria bacterium]